MREQVIIMRFLKNHNYEKLTRYYEITVGWLPQSNTPAPMHSYVKAGHFRKMGYYKK